MIPCETEFFARITLHKLKYRIHQEDHPNEFQRIIIILFSIFEDKPIRLKIEFMILHQGISSFSHIKPITFLFTDNHKPIRNKQENNKSKNLMKQPT